VTRRQPAIVLGANAEGGRAGAWIAGSGSIAPRRR
jgi:hypothetical protein